MIAHAQEATDVARSFLAQLNDVIIFPLITLMMTIALVVFLYGAFQFVQGANNSQSREAGKRHLIFGIIGMLVMISAYTILYIATNTFGVDIPDTGVGF